MKRIRRILHPSDFSPASRAVFARAVDMAKVNAATLLLVHVRSPVSPLFGDYISPQTFEQLARAAWQKRLDALVTRARKAGVRARSFLFKGAPHVEIVRAARSKRADLIVMGTYGRSGLARLFLGSVAERVVATALCPVLTVRGVRNG
ncbi:MAG: universal stress protein [Candidatus Rokuibacteriota bacterium]